MARKGNSNNAPLRNLAASMSENGMRCDYCGVPSAATIEHVAPRKHGGRSDLKNIVLACPYCNTRKSTMAADDFRQSDRWQMEYPDDLPGTVPEMLAKYFGWESTMPHLRTGSPHSRLRLAKGYCLLEVRPGRKYPWETFTLGSIDNPGVAKASYDFLKRH